MKPKKLKTNKLFYGKWPYKLTCFVRGANLIITNMFESTGELRIRGSYNDWRGIKRVIDPVALRQFANIIQEYLDKEVKFRMEYDNVQIYVKDKLLLKDLEQKLSPYLRSITEPENDKELDLLLDNKKYVIADRYPKGLYRYKVILKPMPIVIRESFYKWLSQYDEEKISIPNSTIKHLTKSGPWWNDVYFYAADSSMIVMANLAAQGYIRRTEEYVLRSSINTLA